MMECCLKKIHKTVSDFTKHRFGMLLIDGVLSYDFEKKEINTFAYISDTNLFYEHAIDGTYAYVGFELAAQSVSTYIGLESKMYFNTEAQRGYILKIINLECLVPTFSKDETILIYAKETGRMDSVAHFEAEIRQHNSLVVTVSFMAMITSEEVEKL